MYVEGNDPEYGPAPTRAEFGFSDDDVVSDLDKIEGVDWRAWGKTAQMMASGREGLCWRVGEEGAACAGFMRVLACSDAKFVW